jgi:hypothetical protein
MVAHASDTVPAAGDRGLVAERHDPVDHVRLAGIAEPDAEQGHGSERATGRQPGVECM